MKKEITSALSASFGRTRTNLMKFICLFGTVALSATMQARPVTPAVAQNVGSNFLTLHNHVNVSTMALAHTETSATGEAVYYVFNINANDGFIIMSADDATHPVIGYIPSGQYTPVPEGSTISYWLTKRKNEILNVRTKHLTPASSITAEWTVNTMNARNSNSGNISVMDVTPLLSTTWNQLPYYNAQCPSGSVTGCVATAMSQIMKFWSYPTTGTSSSSYCDCSATPPTGFTMANSYGTLSATYSTTTYSWSSMPNNVTSANAAVATIMYQAGVSVDMNYDPSGSSSYLIYPGHACALNSYTKYFRYDSLTIQGLTRSDYTDSAWSAILVNDLTKGHPIQYAGADATQGGHSWVCDGYQSSSGFFHMNWGWGGSYNGYFSLDALNPDTYDFIQSEQAIVGIQPVLALPPVSDFTSDATTKCGSGTITFEDQSSNLATSWAWTFTGGTPSTSTAQNPAITYTAPGTYSVSLTASNSHGTGTPVTKTSYITILSTSMPAVCTPTTGNLANNYGIGTYNVTLNTINKSSGGAVSDGGYQNFSCQNYTTLLASTVYTINVTVGTANNENIKVYIDYNNNGSLADAGELVWQKTGVTGLQSGTFTTPATPTAGSYLRMRVMDDFSNISTGCSNPSYGQAEDYGVYFSLSAPVATFTSNITSVCVGNSVNYTDQSTNSPTSWAWTFTGGNPATSSSQNPVVSYTATGTYSVSLKATNATGNNTKTVSGYITVNATPSATATFSNVSCNGAANGTATVSASGGTSSYTYSWTPSGGTSAIATGLVSGNYTCTIKDANSCATTKAVSITQPSAYTVTATQTNTSCFATANGTATITASGATPSYTYSWTPSGGTSAIASSLSSGSYTCTIKDANNCVATKVVSITQPTAFTVTATQANVSCFGNANGTATLTTSGATPSYTYSWTPSGGTSATASSLSPGSYTCTIKDVNNCVTTKTVSITQPAAYTVTATQTNASCFGSANGTASVTASGATPSYTYSWSPMGGTSATASGLPSGNYMCTIKDANNCVNTETVNITQPSAYTVTATQTNASCFGTTNGIASVTASGGTPSYTYSWSPMGGISASASSLSSGNYTCTIKDANNCVATEAVSITQPAAITSSQSFTLCQGQNITVGSSTYTTTGVYSKTLAAAGGCDSTVTTNLMVNALPIVAASVNTATLCTGSSDTLSAGGASTYTWSANAGGATTNTVSVSPTVNTTYTLTGTNSQGCVNSDTVGVIVETCTSTGINKSSNNYGVLVYPNPTSGIVSLQMNEYENVSFEVYSVIGQKVLTQTMQTNVQEINLALLADGIYQIRVLKNNTMVFQTKVVKQ